MAWTVPSLLCVRSLGGNHGFSKARNGRTPFLYPDEMKLFKGLIVLFTLTSVIACRNGNGNTSAFLNERDSIIKENRIKTQQLDELNGIISVIANGLDSIAMQENMLINNNGREGVMLDRNQIAANLKNMEDILARQRLKIQELQDSLARQKTTQGIERLQKIIGFLNQQLAAKDKVIKSLRADLNDSKKSITQLRASISDMQSRVDNAERKTQALTNAVKTQNNIINECYVKIGTKKQLAAAGLLKGGFLKKKKVNYQDVEKSKFNAVDIRRFREVTLKSSNPKILTPQPSNRSYHFEDNGDGTCTLVITNPTQFWSVSNFLIIQL